MIKLKHILHPTDFSDNSSLALKYACSLAKQFEAELHLINVVQNTTFGVPPVPGVPADFYQQQTQYADLELASFPDKVVKFDGSLTRELCEGVPFVEIIRYAKEKEIDMIVMGTHGYSGLQHLIMGSVAENVVRKAPCPVLTVHPEDFKFVMP